MKLSPPPFLYAVYGNLQILPKPTDIAMHDSKNSIGLSHVSRTGPSCSSGASVALFCLYLSKIMINAQPISKRCNDESPPLSPSGWLFLKS